MESISESIKNFDYIKTDEYWNFGEKDEDKMHRIHTYPAKFPSFITIKALEYAREKKVNVATVGDIFCGCGTVAYEVAKQGYDFWGCDVNPVASLIARVKSKRLEPRKLTDYFEKIIGLYTGFKMCIPIEYKKVNSRILYWFEEERIEELERLLYFIESVCGKDEDYKEFFLCAFSNILKSTSRWLTKSIKPTVDSKKITKSALYYFKRQYKKMYISNLESKITGNTVVDIKVVDSLKIQDREKIDLLVTSPPYVTSYEYADLHQLSLLWLGFTDDYREFRKDTIGSVFEKEIDTKLKLNKIGEEVLKQLNDNKESKSRSKAVRKYYLDMEKIVLNSYRLLNDGGMALFVIGNTEYKNVRIKNAEHLALAMIENGFSNVEVTKRNISNKILTPYRNSQGKFSKEKTGKKIYSEEFIVVGRK